MIQTKVRACRFCQCTEEQACEGGCAWVDDKHETCDHPVCLSKLAVERKLLPPAIARLLAEVHDPLRQQLYNRIHNRHNRS